MTFRWSTGAATTPRFAVPIALGAFLLFVVQPILGRLILPWFGGAAAAWLACLLFFQTGLLAGYGYAHLTTRKLSPRAQAGLHVGLLAVAVLVLPITPDPEWRPPPGAASIGGALLLLAGSAGLPYVLLASTGPMLQSWFVAALPGHSPYRFYALSNAASLLGLALYPFVIEPVLGLTRQVTAWSWLFGAFVLATGWCALPLIIRTGGAVPVTGTTEDGGAAPRAGEVVMWVALAAAASAMLLATTNQLATEVTGFPFVWVAPLAIYLLTFVVCFDHERWYDRRVFLPLLAVAVTLAVATLTAGTRAQFWTQLVVYGGALGACGMVCHGELVRLKPAPRFVTSFYLAIAAGGALGGAFVALAAPLVFRGYWELHVSLAACCVLALLTVLDDRRAVPGAGYLVAAYVGVVVLLVGLLAAVVVLRFSREAGLEVEPWSAVRAGVLSLSLNYRKYLVMGATAALIAGIGLIGDWLNARAGASSRWHSLALPAAAMMLPVALLVQMMDFSRRSIHAERNFYGLLRVVEWGGDAKGEGAFRELVHGHINHGTQYLDPGQDLRPTAYYGYESGIGVALAHRGRLAPQHAEGASLRLGVIGLGIGTLATYGRPGDVVRFYELDPAVARLATQYFTYLARSAAQVEIVIGDARRQMEAELAEAGSQRFDVLAVDAFLGDAIPVHLLTQEAVALYLRHLTEDGLLALHVSNRLLDLRPLARGLAAQYGLRSSLVRSLGRAETGTHDATWVLLARPDNALFADTIVTRATTPWPDVLNRRATVWTDDYSSLWRLLARGPRN